MPVLFLYAGRLPDITYSGIFFIERRLLGVYTVYAVYTVRFA